jgi:hypothetical protein
VKLPAGDAVGIQEREEIAGVFTTELEKQKITPLAMPTTAPGNRGGYFLTTVPSTEGSGPGSGEAVARA